MRKLLISVAAAGAALVVAAPASAQYYQGQPYGYNGYGQNNYGQVRALQARIDRLQWQINALDRGNVVRDDRADRLREESRNIERRLRSAARYGLNPYEVNDIQARVARLEQRLQYASYNRNGRGGYDGYRGDRDDRYDRGDRHGGDHDRDNGRWDRDDD